MSKSALKNIRELVSPIELRMLKSIADNPRRPTSDRSFEFGLSKAGAFKIIQRLYKKGLVAKTDSYYGNYKCSVFCPKCGDNRTCKKKNCKLSKALTW